MDGNFTRRKRRLRRMLCAGVAPLLIVLSLCSGANAQCTSTVTADVVAFDQPITFNRLGAINPNGMMFALREDVVDKTNGLPIGAGGIAGQVKLRSNKRPRPIVLRVNEGECLQINFTNLLNPAPQGEQPFTRQAGIHVNGMQLVGSIASDGSFVGKNASSFADPGQSKVYKLYAEKENVYHLYSEAAPDGGEGKGGTLSWGLFGAVNVEPKGSVWLRSQITYDEMQLVAPTKTADGHPIVDYNKRYPADWPDVSLRGRPVLKMRDVNKTVHSDINAIITGPNLGFFPAGQFPANPAYPNRQQPFREFTTIFHDETQMVQAFPEFTNPTFKAILNGVKDGFAINYGSAAIGPEILANRKAVGPMADCAGCKYEEFFLTSWAVGDPAMIVDVPANAPQTLGQINAGTLDPQPAPRPKASRAFFPDDPSNVHHSYINDHVKFRNVHNGPKEHHIYHLHSHQWLFTPNDDNSNYLDAQQVGPGSGYTYDIAHGGSGNRNKTPGDAIYHCHFYPHFAQGMWALWRNNDTFEGGTPLVNGIPVAGSRAYPDGEIVAGTPIPAVVPMPGLAMAPMPGKVEIVSCREPALPGDPARDAAVCGPVNNGGQIKFDQADLVNKKLNPGFPFYIAARAGHRPSTPVLDMAPMIDGSGLEDGGLPRHLILSGETTSVVTTLSFDKKLDSVASEVVPETGTQAELNAMEAHAQLLHPTFKPDGTPAQYELNGLPPSPGAPFAEPCRQDNGDPLPGSIAGALSASVNRIYKGVMFQFDMTVNKVGWHHPQARIESLWEDAGPTVNGDRPPQPFVMRANTGECIEFWHTNLIPSVYEQDDFQVKTPTDVVGQHIHLVKFDVTSSDGAGNGWNYEDGTMSPDEIRERIHAINTFNQCGQPGKPACFEPKLHSFFGSTFNGRDITGARTQLQKWYMDPLLNNQGKDRGLGNVFTHDHFGPSTHQQLGLYATLLSEPRGSVWKHPETGALLGTGRDDGGPTWFAANIEDGANSYREFFLEFQDFFLAYRAGSGGDALNPGPDPAGAINPPGGDEVGLPFLHLPPIVAGVCPNGLPIGDAGCPTAISAQDDGTFLVNYRNETLALRVANRLPANNRDNNVAQAAGVQGDLSHALRSIERAIPDLNVQPTFFVEPIAEDMGDFDPFTPLLRVYEDDQVRLRVQVGATEESHMMTVHGMKWTQEYASPNSGYRNTQSMGISEQFQFKTPVIADKGQVQNPTNTADYLYTTNASINGWWNGSWGLMRSYGKARTDLKTLPNNPIGADGHAITNLTEFNNLFFKGVCPALAPKRKYNVTAVLANKALGNPLGVTIPEADDVGALSHLNPMGGTLVYNSRATVADRVPPGAVLLPDLGVGDNTKVTGPLHDPTAILFVQTADLNTDGTLKTGVPIEPLVLRAKAGECIEVTLNNQLPLDPALMPDLAGFNTIPPIIPFFNANQVRPSNEVGLHPQLVEFDITRGDGTNVGTNPVQTVKPNESKVYRWYAGNINYVRNTKLLLALPAQFGGTNLIPSDPIKHTGKGAIGALIIEPALATNWTTDAGTRASATVNGLFQPFRDFTILKQHDINMRQANGTAVPQIFGGEDAEDSGHKAINYKSEPLWYRMGINPFTPLDLTHQFDWHAVFANSAPTVGGVDPETPIFKAAKGQDVRFHVLDPGGQNRNSVFSLHGHVWQREPYILNSFSIGNNPRSQWIGSQEGWGPTSHFEVIPQNGAGGKGGVTGDYLYRDQASFSVDQGLWGLFRVK